MEKNKKYNIIKLIGKGGFGEVYLIKKDKKNFALKKLVYKLSENEKEKYNNILKILYKIDNEYIIKYYYSFEENDSFNIVMEYGGDTNLKQFIHAHKAKANLIGEKLIENIIIQICLGLKEIHDNNIIHRDLTPDNIFIDENNKIKIGDFGISKILTASNKYANSTVGKYKYFAPELVKGEKHNNKIDIYSLGCIIYELFTLSEYYVDTKIDGKEGKINLEIYNKKWQELIDLLLINDYHKRPNIGEILFKLINNEIKITVYVSENEINKKIYFLKNNENPENNHLVEYYKNKNVKTQEMDETNTELYIDEIKHNFRNYFIPYKEGIYQIRLKIHCLLKDCSFLFYNCIYIVTIDLSLINTEKVTNMAHMFDNCKMNNLCLTSFNTENVTNMEYMFSGCQFLQSLDISTFNTKNVKNMGNMFHFCIELKKFIISPLFNTEKVINMEYMFCKCNIKDTDIDFSLFNTRNVINMEGMFCGSPSLENLNLSSFNTKNVTNMSRMFYSLYHLEHIDYVCILFRFKKFRFIFI